jgi:hypothetical protein
MIGQRIQFGLRANNYGFHFVLAQSLRPFLVWDPGPVHRKGGRAAAIQSKEQGHLFG